MNPIRLFIVSALLVILGVWARFAKFQGNLEVHRDRPFGDTSSQGVFFPVV